MKWLTFYGFVFSFLLMSCFGNSLPKGVLSQKEMEPIVWDLMKADELAQQNKLADTTLSLKTESFRLYDQVFTIHKTTREEYYKSYRYYQSHPDLFRSLMNNVKKTAEKEKKAILSGKG